MPQTRKLVRDGIRGALAHQTTGFNSKFAALAGAYGLAPALSIHWDPLSRQVFQGFIGADLLDLSQIADFPAVVIYTSRAENQLLTMPTKFSGTITGHADFYLRFDLDRNSGGPERDDTDSWSDAVEDAVIEALHAYTGWSGGVAFLREFRCERDPVVLLGDGWAQRLPFEIFFEVTA